MITLTSLQSLIAKEFGIECTAIKKIAGYDNANYLIHTATTSYVFKTYKYTQELFDIVNEESDVLAALSAQQSASYPTPITFTDEQFVKVLILDGERCIVRMLSYLSGSFTGDCAPSEVLYHHLGEFLANLDLQLQPLRSVVYKGRQWEWDLEHLMLNKKYVSDIPMAHDRAIVSYFMMQYQTHVLPALPTLRKQLIHNDANEYNILCNNNKITGIIDFGDMTHSALINEVAIALTYICYDKEDPLRWAIAFLKGYHSRLPLEIQEVDLLYYLIAGRLCTSVCNAANAKKNDPTNTYATSSEDQAWKALYRWLEINPLKAKNSFRTAIGTKVAAAPSIKEKKALRERHISTILSLSYDEPIYMTGSAFQYMYDGYGNTYLDAYNNIPHVGHTHPKVVAAAQNQMATLNTNTRYLYDGLEQYAHQLVAKMPKGLNKVFFVNSGSAASDLAIRMAQAHTQQKTVMVMEHGYHGNTQIGIDISDYKFNDGKGQGQPSYIVKTAIPDRFRGKHKGKDAGSRYAQQAITDLHQLNRPVAAFISEPIVGCGGQIPLAPGYLKEVYPAIRAQGGVCISDEVQTGFGRIGTHFWGFEAQGVVPDMVILGKPMGNAHPIGAVITTTPIAQSFEQGVEFFSSFGGNPVSCAIGQAVLDVIEEENLQQQALETGTYYKEALLQLKDNFNAIGDIRGSGLFLGIDIVKEDGITPHTVLAQHLKNELKKRHILLSTDGPENNVIKSKPPLCFTKANAQRVVDTLKEVLTAYYKG